MNILNAINLTKNLIFLLLEEQNIPLTFTAALSGSTIKLTKIGSPNTISLQYKLNDSNWTDYTINKVITLTNIGDYVQFKGSTTTFSKDYYSNYYKFVMNGKINGSGNTNSLINYSDLTNYCFACLFRGCTSLILTSKTLLPATTLANSCYRYMFNNCTSLITAPALPATNLASYCYQSMFENCTSLSTAPLLPATNLANSCYNRHVFIM